MAFARAGCSLAIVVASALSQACEDAGRIDGRVSSARIGSVVEVQYEPVSIDSRVEIVDLADEFLLGSEGGDPDYVFSTIEAIAVDSDGRIYVLDSKNYRVQVFDEEGALIASIGRQGSGPGEFTGRLVGLALPAAQMVVYDFRGWSFHLWDLVGEPAFRGRSRLPTLLSTYQFLGTPHGSVLVGAEVLGAPGGAGQDPGHWNLLELDTEGHVDREFVRIAIERPQLTLGERSLGLYVAENRTPMFAVASNTGQIFYSAMDDYEIHSVSSDGTDLWSIRVPWPRMPYTDEIKRRALEHDARFTGSASTSDVAWPDRLSALSFLATDGAGRLYVVPASHDSAGQEEFLPVDVYSPSGERILAGKLRRRFDNGAVPGMWMAASGPFVYGKIEPRDSTSVQVARYRLLLPVDEP